MKARIAFRGSSGFTLIELMVTVIIIGLLAAIAIPSYSRYVLRASRSAAQTVLTDLMARQESFRLQNRAYATDFASLKVLPAGSTASTVYMSRGGAITAGQVAASVYQLDFASSTSVCGSTTPAAMVATPVGKQVGDACAVLTLCLTGKRESSGSTKNCW